MINVIGKTGVDILKKKKRVKRDKLASVWVSESGTYFKDTGGFRRSNMAMFKGGGFR